MNCSFKLTCRLLVVFLLPIISFANTSERPADFRLVVTGGVKGIHDGYRAFYMSPLFRLGGIADKEGVAYRIENATLKAFTDGESVYLSFAEFDKADVLKAAKQRSRFKKKREALLGAQAYGFALGETGEVLSFNDLFLNRKLGATFGDLVSEVRYVGDTKIYAFSLNASSKAINWPTKLDTLRPIGAVQLVNDKTRQNYVFFPRKIASTPAVFGLVDSLLKDKRVPTGYIDMGNSLVAPEDESVAMAKNMQDLLLARKPLAMGASRYDFSVLFKSKELLLNSPYVLALNGVKGTTQSRFRKLGNNYLQFSALGGLSDFASGFLPKGVESFSSSQAIQNLQNNKTKTGLIVGLAENSHSASVAVTTSYFDAVLGLVSGRNGTLPASDDISLAKNYKAGLGSVSPLVRVSSSDVTEVMFWKNKAGRIERIAVKRHFITNDAKNSKDALSLLKVVEGIPTESWGLPPLYVGGKYQPWRQIDLDLVLGSMLLSAYPNASVAILEKDSRVTPINSGIPLRLAQNLLVRPGRVVSLNLQGKFLKRIIKAAKKRKFGLPIAMVGGSIKRNTISGRRIEDLEMYEAVVTENVHQAIDEFLQREGLFATQSLGSNTLLTAIKEGTKDSIKLLSELKKKNSADYLKIGDRGMLLDSSRPIVEIVHEALVEGVTPSMVERFRYDANSRVRQSIVFEIPDISVGVKWSGSNDTLSQWQDDIKEGKHTGFSESRFWGKDELHLLLFMKMALKYYGPVVDADLVFSEKFFQPNSDATKSLTSTSTRAEVLKAVAKARPSKDSSKITSSIYFPFNRVLDKPFLPAINLNLMLQGVYETQIWPNSLMTSIKPENWQYVPNRVNEGRVFLGLGARPLVALKNARLGGIVTYDFNRIDSIQALAAGVEAGVEGKWSLGVVTLGLDTTVRQTFPFTRPDDDRIGFVGMLDGFASVPIYGNFSLSALANLTAGTRMAKPTEFGINGLIGFGVSYGGTFKWLI